MEKDEERMSGCEGARTGRVKRRGFDGLRLFDVVKNE